VKAGLAILVAATLTSAVLAQQPPAFRARIDIVLLDVSVVDRRGMPVRNLSAEDFGVELDGVSQPVRLADFIEFSTGHVSGLLGSAPATAVASQTAQVGRSVLIVADDLSSTGLDLRSVLDGAVEWLPTLGPRDQVAFTTTSGRGQTIDFTRVRSHVAAALRAAGTGQGPTSPLRNRVRLRDIFHPPDISGLRGVAGRTCDDSARRGETPSGLVEACVFATLDELHHFQFRAERAVIDQSDAVLSLLRQLQQVAGTRVMVVLSNGLMLGGGTGYLMALRRAAEHAGVFFYVVTPDVQRQQVVSDQSTEIRMDDERWVKDGLDQLADVLEGVAFRVGNNTAPAFARILSDVAGTYRLGVDASSVISDRPFVTARVTVRSAGAVVRNASRILRSEPTPVVPTVDTRIRDILTTGEAVSGVPLEWAHTIARDESGGRIQITTSLTVPAGVPNPGHATFVVVGDDGAEVRGGTFPIRPDADGAFRASFAIAVPAGRYRMRVAVADANGNIGMVERSVLARLRPVGPFFGGDIILAWRADKGWSALSGEIVPDAARALALSFDVYSGTAAGVDPKFRLTLLDAARQQVGTRALSTSPVPGGWRASSELDLQGLPPGVYDLELTVTTTSGDAAPLVARFRKTSAAAPPVVNPQPSAAGPPPVPPPPTPTPESRATREGILAALQAETRASWPRFAIQDFLTVRSARSDVAQFARDVRAVVPRPLVEANDATWWPSLDSVATAQTDAVGDFGRALLALRRGDARSAEVALLRTLQLAPSSIPVMVWLGASYAQAGRDDEALGAWQMALAAGEIRPEWILAAADALGRRGEMVQSLEQLRSIVEGAPGQVLRTVHGLILLGRFDEARLLAARWGRSAVPDGDRLRFISTALTFAEALIPGPPGAVRAAFEAEAARYLASGGVRAPVVKTWLSMLDSQ
jgi:VWFA-related protein